MTIWDGSFAREIGRIRIPPNPMITLIGDGRGNTVREVVQGPNVAPMMALTADGARIAVAISREASVLVWDTATSELLLRLTVDDVPAFLAFTAGGQLIAVSSSGDLTIWETQRPKCAQCPKAPASRK